MRLGDTLRITTPRPPSGPVDYGALAREAAEEALKGAHIDSAGSLHEFYLTIPPRDPRGMTRISVEQAGAAARNAAGNAAMAVRDAVEDEMDRLRAENARLREKLAELGMRSELEGGG